jgi:hypothetical protein
MAILITLLIIAVFDVVVWLWGVDSRPGFDGGCDDRKERFFPHSKTD